MYAEDYETQLPIGMFWVSGSNPLSIALYTMYPEQAEVLEETCGLTTITDEDGYLTGGVWDCPALAGDPPGWAYSGQFRSAYMVQTHLNAQMVLTRRLRDAMVRFFGSAYSGGDQTLIIASDGPAVRIDSSGALFWAWTGNWSSYTCHAICSVHASTKYVI